MSNSFQYGLLQVDLHAQGEVIRQLHEGLVLHQVFLHHAGVAPRLHLHFTLSLPDHENVIQALRDSKLVFVRQDALRLLPIGDLMISYMLVE